VGTGVSGPVRVVLADDHPIWRDGVAADLGDGFEVVGTAGTATEAVAVIRETQPDLVVCDLTMPEGGGLKVVRECAGETRIVVLTVSEMERDVLDAVAAGAVGYLVKSTPGPELRAALVRAAAGEPVFSSTLAALVLGEFRRLSKAATGANPLSEREREVLRLAGQGLPSKEIAARLFLTSGTVRNYLSDALRKLECSNRLRAAQRAEEAGWL
jgi:DNA-binding NarL/FixJ family response regulator